MKYRRLGSSGVKVSSISLGSWLTYGNAVLQQRTDDCVRAAFEGGVNFFDTADIYNRGEAERALSCALQPFRREDYVLATKAFWPMSDGVNDRGLSRKHLMEACHASLERLGTDYLDLYQCHRFDPETPVEEVVRAMEDLIRQGKVLYWGTSVWSAAQIVTACDEARQWGAYRPVSNQPQYNLLHREIEADIMPTSRERGIGQIVYCPLAQGLLTGKYRGGTVPDGSRAADERNGSFLRPQLTERNVAAADRVADLAAELGHTPAQLALAWILRHPEVSSAIIGATRAEQVTENLAAADLALDDEMFERLNDWTAPASDER